MEGKRTFVSDDPNLAGNDHSRGFMPREVLKEHLEENAC